MTTFAQLPLKQLQPVQGQPAGDAPTATSGQNTPTDQPAVEAPEFSLDETITELTSTALTLIKGLASTWTLVQIGVVLLCYVAARVVSNALTPALEERVRRIESQPQLLRVLVIPLRRLTWILFALSLWLAAYVLREVTWPSRSYYIGIAATIVIVGVVISLISRFIRNRSLATPFFYAAWAVAALHIVGLLDETLAALDAIAFSIGSFRLSLLAVIKAVLLLTVLAWVATIVGNFVERRLRQNEDIAPALQVLIAKFVKFTLLTIAVLATISAVGIDLTALTIFSGALGLGIGFGLQKVASNLISGIIILSDRSIKPGDVISLGDTFGWINSLKSRYVSVITRDGVEYLIPNESFVSEQVVNWSYSTRNVRLEIKFGVSYEADPHVVRKLATDAVTQIERVIERPAPVCHVVGFGDSSVDFVLRFWIRDPKNGLTNVRGQAFLALWDAFKANGIDIPYPHRQLIFPKDAGEPAPKATPKRTTRRGRKRKTVA